MRWNEGRFFQTADLDGGGAAADRHLPVITATRSQRHRAAKEQHEQHLKERPASLPEGWTSTAFEGFPTCNFYKILQFQFNYGERSDRNNVTIYISDAEASTTVRNVILVGVQRWLQPLWPHRRGSSISVADFSGEAMLVYLSVSLGHLLVQALVAVDGDLQLLHLGRQPSLAADFTPGLHLRQELRKQHGTHTHKHTHRESCDLCLYVIVEDGKMAAVMRFGITVLSPRLWKDGFIGLFMTKQKMTSTIVHSSILSSLSLKTKSAFADNGLP